MREEGELVGRVDALMEMMGRDQVKLSQLSAELAASREELRRQRAMLSVLQSERVPAASKPVRRILRLLKGTLVVSRLKSAIAGSAVPSPLRAEVDAVRATGLFDEQYYLDQNADVAAAGEDAALHFVAHGWREGRRPNPYFDPAWYLAHYADVRAGGDNPLLHYDRYGWRENRQPGGDFDGVWYRDYHADVRGADINPLLHFLLWGRAEGRLPLPKFAAEEVAISPLRGEVDAVRATGLFDEQYYLDQNADVAAAGEDAALHFVCHGWREGRRPNPYFDPAWYLAHYADVRASGGNPLLHYDRYGWREKRQPGADFDGVWYREHFADVSRADINPLLHFLRWGGAEGRQPLPEAANTQPRMGIIKTREYTYHVPRRTESVDAEMAAFRVKPLLSIVTPVYNVEPDFLRQAVQSVLCQWYENWELCLVDDCSPRDDTRDALAEFDDPRIKVSFEAQNTGISGASNRGLEMATGDYVVLMDHDDELTPDALFEIVRCINQTGADYIYSDEDKVDESDRFSQPFFKPDWSPDSFMSIMYTCHISAFSRSLLDKVGGFRRGYEGAQDYDLVLRATEQAQRVEHIAKVLYHWRIHSQSIAADMSAKPYAVRSLVKAKEDALERRGWAGTLEEVPNMPGQYRVAYHVKGAPAVSIIIPTKNNRDILRQCIDSILAKTAYGYTEIIVVNNQTTDSGALDYYRTLSENQVAKVIDYPYAFNYSRINNVAAARAQGQFLLFLNDDTEVIHPDWLERMLGYAQLPHVGAVGAKLLYPGRDTVQHCGVVNLREGPGHAFHNTPPDKVEYFGRNALEYNWLAVTGACLLVERSKFNQIGGFDEDLPVAYNDVDLCMRLYKAGYHNVVCQAVRLYHHESISRGVDHVDAEKMVRLRKERQRLFRKHPDLYMTDPYYNPNLSPSHAFRDVF